MRPIGVDDIAAMRMEGDLREALRALQDDASATCDRNRRAVLAQPDLAGQLTEPPCKFASPGMWTGYIGPSHLEGRYGETVVNDSPYRAQLLALVAEAEQRSSRTESAA